MDIFHGSVNLGYLTDLLFTYSCLMMNVRCRNMLHFMKASVSSVIKDRCVDWSCLLFSLWNTEGCILNVGDMWYKM